MLIFGYRRLFNKPGRAEKLSHHGNVAYSICVHPLVS